MIDVTGSPEPPLAPDKSGIAFKSWLRRLVTGVAELQAFDAGEIDAVMDRESGRALLLPEAQIALHDANRQVFGALDALPFTLSMAAPSAQGPVVALLTREWHDEIQLPAKPRGRGTGKPRRTPKAARAGTENQLLAALPAKDHARLASGLEPVTMASGEVLYEAGERIREVYFPINCVLSMLTLVEGHRALEVGLVGREGMIGARLALGATKSSVRVLVQGTGTAMRMNSTRFLREFRRSQTLQRVLLQFTSRLMDQISQTAACNRFHVVEERLARCLLMTAARSRSAEFRLTHGFLADMLGVRREGVTVAAIALQRRGLIRYRRGTITILEHQGLEAACCSCYRHLQVMDSESRRSTSTG